jgi:hypothetical protein
MCGCIYSSAVSAEIEQLFPGYKETLSDFQALHLRETDIHALWHAFHILSDNHPFVKVVSLMEYLKFEMSPFANKLFGMYSTTGRYYIRPILLYTHHS